MNYKGGRIIENGYVMVLCPSHPRKHKNYMREHVLVMEQHLGRYLTSDEIVHHINGDKTDNRIENLELMTRRQHIVMHNPAKQRTAETFKKMGATLKRLGIKPPSRKGVKRTVVYSR